MKKYFVLQIKNRSNFDHILTSEIKISKLENQINFAFFLELRANLFDGTLNTRKVMFFEILRFRN